MIMLLLGITMLIVALFTLYRLLRREKVALDIAIPHRILPNGILEVELEDLSVLWMDVIQEENTEPEPIVQETEHETTDWHNSDDFIQFLTNCINERINLCSGSNFSAFSFNDMVYLTPFSLWSYIILYTKAKNIANVQKEKQATMLSVVGSLTKRGFIRAGDIKEGKYAAVYLITASQKDTKLKPKGVYIPLIGKYFNTDNKREGILTFISNIEPYKEASNAE